MATVGVIIPAFNAAKTLPIRPGERRVADLRRLADCAGGRWQHRQHRRSRCPVPRPLLPQDSLHQAGESRPARGKKHRHSRLIRRVPRAARCRRRMAALPPRGVAEGSARAAAGWPRLWRHHQHRPGWQARRIILGESRFAEGRIAPRIYMRKVELPCPTLTFRSKCIDEVGFFDETMRATEDRDLCLRIALRYEVAFVPRVIAYYRVSAQFHDHRSRAHASRADAVH